MSCSVAVASYSPASNFSPSHHRHTIACHTTSSPEALTLSSNASPSSTSPKKSPFKSSSRFTPRAPTALFKSSSPSPSNYSPTHNGLKRKRPVMRIDVPVMMDGALSFAPIGSDGRKEVEVDGGRCAVYCKRGKKRIVMEDRFNIELDVLGDSRSAFFGIFDGHSGTKAAEFASDKLGKNIVAEAMREDINLEEAVTNGYIKTDSEFLKEEVGSGTCCVTAFVKKGELLVSNAGDCRAVLSVSGSAEALTFDHRPSREDEKERIESLGGYVDFCRGVMRVQGSLAVSRAIGDSHMKQWVIPNPGTKILSIKPEFEFLILASDGLWDKVSNQEAVDIARPLCTDSQNGSPLSACKKLAELSSNRGSFDDISVMIVQLRHFI